MSAGKEFGSLTDNIEIMMWRCGPVCPGSGEEAEAECKNDREQPQDERFDAK